MRQYNGMWYRPDYGYELKQNGRLVSHSKKVKGAACFARVFNFFDRKTTQEFDGTYTLKCRKDFDPRSGNFCPMSNDQVRKVLRYMRTTFEMGVGFKETEQDYVLTFRIQGKPVKHKFILTFSRVFFEYPYNEMALDVLKLREHGPINGISYRNKSFLDLYHLLHAIYNNYCGGGHALFCYTLREPYTKDLPEGFGLQTDNILAEFNVPPVQKESEFVENIEFMKNIIRDMAKKFNENYDILCQASAKVPAKELKHPQAKEFGWIYSHFIQ